MFSGDTGLRGRRPGFGPLSLRSDQTGHRGLGEKSDRAHTLVTISSLSATLLCMYVYIYDRAYASSSSCDGKRACACAPKASAADARVQKIARPRAGPEAVCLLPAAAATSALCMCPERRQWQSQRVQIKSMMMRSLRRFPILGDLQNGSKGLFFLKAWLINPNLFMFAKLENVITNVITILTFLLLHESESALFEGNTAFFRAPQKKSGVFIQPRFFCYAAWSTSLGPPRVDTSGHCRWKRRKC